MKTILKAFHTVVFLFVVLCINLQSVQPVKAVAPDQVITVDTHAPTNAAYGESFTVAASADSGLVVAYSASGACTNVGATFTITSGTGTCIVQYDQAGDINYNPAAQVTENVTAHPVAITVTAGAKSKNVGDSDPVLTYTITSGALVGADDFTGALTRDPGESAGDYAITQGTLALDSNYALTYIGANLTIVPASTATPTVTETPTVTATPSETATPTSTETVTVTATKTATITKTVTATKTATKTRTATATITPAPVTFYVATTGSNLNTCKSVSAPCKTIGGALNKTKDGDTVKVALGTYYGTGNEVVSITRSINLLGGWNAAFTAQNGKSVVDGQKLRSGMTISGASVVVDHFTIQHGFSDYGAGGIDNLYVLLLKNSTVSENSANYYAPAAIFNQATGTMTITNTIVRNNSEGTDSTYKYSVVKNDGKMVLNNSSVSFNKGSGIYARGLLTTLNHSTVNNNTRYGIYNVFSTVYLNDSTFNNNGHGIYNYSGNVIMNNSTANGNSTGIYNGDLFTINNSTIGNNSGIGLENDNGEITLKNSTIAGNLNIGIENSRGSVTLQNSIVANNAHDCPSYGGIISAGYNLISNTAGCKFVAKVSDRINIDAKLGQLIGVQGYAPLLPGSPAINTGPATCPLTDQRGMARPQGGRCDRGAYEYTSPGAAVSFQISKGTNQSKPVGVKADALAVYVVDRVGSPVQGVLVSFTAPTSGPGGRFAITNTYYATAITDFGGVAVAPTFTVNNWVGSYTVRAVITNPSRAVTFSLTNLPILTIFAPADNVDSSTPTYQWANIVGATLYQYEVWHGSQRLFSKTIAPSQCSITTCSDTHTYYPLKGLYRWRVRVMLGGVWKNFSNFQPFQIVIKSGFWNGPGVEFYVTPDHNSVSRFAVFVYVTGCGSYKITYTKLIPVTYSKFSFGTQFDVSGAFLSPLDASGRFALHSYNIPGCGYVSGGPFYWTATWAKAAAQPATFMPATLVPAPANALNLDPASYTVERISP